MHTWSTAPRRLVRLALPLVAVATVLAGLQLTSSGPAARATGVPVLGNPLLSIATPPLMAAACYSGLATTAGCDTAALNAINVARKTEGVRPMVLPTNWASLNSPEQLLVVSDLERVDRHLAPIVGLAPNLDAMAQLGAVTCCDPQGPPGYHWQSNWEAGSGTPLAADFQWMYNDGPGSTNANCPPACWAHRDNILGPGGLMGAGAFGAALTELFVQGYPQAPVFTWNQELPFLGLGATPSSLAVGAAPGTTNRVAEYVYNTGTPPRVTASLIGALPWQVGLPACSATPGAPCVITVAFSPRSPGTYHATLSVTGPGGTEHIPMVGTSGNGYWQVAADGGIFDFGGGGFRGSTGAVALAAPIVGMAATPDAGGYWLVARDGGVFTFGDARFFGSTGAVRLQAPIVGMVATPSGQGYWLVARDGGVFTFGDARFFGSTGAVRLLAPIVGIAATHDGRGYWLIGQDGGVFTFGDAPFYGSAYGLGLTAPITSVTTTASGRGFWLAGADGNVYPFGDAGYFGSTRGIRLARPVVAIVADRWTGGYWMMATDGGVFSFHAPFLGSTAGAPLFRPVVGAAAS